MNDTHPEAQGTPPTEGRWRQGVAGLAIVVLLIVYAVMVATVGGHIVDWPWWAQLLFYAPAGFLWLLPMRWLLDWSAR